MTCDLCGNECGRSRHAKCESCYAKLDRLIANMLEQGDNGREIATELGMTIDSVNQRISRSRKKARCTKSSSGQ